MALASFSDRLNKSHTHCPDRIVLLIVCIMFFFGNAMRSKMQLN